jgi:hypothetical protein
MRQQQTIAKKQPGPVIVTLGVKHSRGNDIHSVPRDAIEGSGVVLIALPEKIADGVLRLKALGADRIVPISSVSSSLDEDIEHALRTIRVANGAPRSPSQTLVQAGRACVAKFPIETLGEAGPLVEQLARLSGAPIEFAAGSLLACISGLAAGRFQVKVREGFSIEPILWIALVGDASTNKSPAMDTFLKPIRELEAQALRDYKSEVSFAKARGEKTDTIPAPRRTLINNSSIEALQHAAAREGRGFLCSFDELSEWFNSIKGRNSRSSQGDRGSYLAAYNGYPLTIDRRSLPEPLFVSCWGLALLGGIPPSVLAALSTAAELENGDGLDVRMSYLFPSLPPIQLRPDFGDGTAEERLAQITKVIFDWRVQAAQNQTIVFDDAARDKFETWRFDLLNKARKRSSEIDSWVGKLPGLVGRLAGILAILDGALKNEIPSQINADQLSRAAKLADVLTAHRRKVELERGRPTIERLASEFAGFILNHQIHDIDTFEIRRGGVIPGIRTDRVLRQVLLELQTAGWISAKTYISPRADDLLPATVKIRTEVFDLGRSEQ